METMAGSVTLMRVRLVLALALASAACSAGAQSYFFAESRGRDILTRDLTAGELDTLARETRKAEVIRKLVQSTETQSLQAPIVRLYLSCLDRMPDYEGFDYYVQQLSTGEQALDDIAEEMAGSDEFGIRYGTVDNGAFVRLLYQHIFQRSPEPATLQYWTSQLNSGASRAYVLLSLSENPENVYAREREVDEFIAAARLLREAPGQLDRNADLDDYIDAILRRLPQG